MAYSTLAIARRRCKARTKEGRPCRSWALWNDPRQLCLVHAGRGAPRAPVGSARPLTAAAARQFRQFHTVQSGRSQGYPPATT